MAQQINPRVFMDFSVGEQPAQRVIFELFKDKVPITAENFRALCTGEKGLSQKSGVPLYYKGSTVHRIVQSFMIQGGDFVSGDGKGGESIYGGSFDDERLDIPIDKEGLLVMANRGPNTNGSQWFVTLNPAEHLNGKHVVFGRVQAGLPVVQAIADVEVDAKSRPVPHGSVVIVHCGELELKRMPAKAPVPRKRSLSDSRSPSPSPSRSRSFSRSRSRSRSASVSSRSSESSHAARKRRKKERKEYKKAKKAAKKAKKLKLKATPLDNLPPPPSREEEDEAVRREEERKEEADRLREAETEMRIRAEDERRERKARELEELKRRAAQSGGSGVVYKGRGRMQYQDPDSRAGGMRGW